MPEMNRDVTGRGDSAGTQGEAGPDASLMDRVPASLPTQGLKNSNKPMKCEQITLTTSQGSRTLE